MGLRLRSIRQRIFLLVLVPVLSLDRAVPLRDEHHRPGRHQCWPTRTRSRTPPASRPAISWPQLDAERPLAMVYMSAPSGANLAMLEAQESKTNAAAAALQAAAHLQHGPGQRIRAGEAGHRALLADAANLRSLRSQIAAQIITRPRALAEYDAMASDAYQVLNAAILQETNAKLVAQALAFVRMGKSEEMLLQEDALLLGDMAAQSFPAGDRQQFTELVGARRALYAQTLATSIRCTGPLPEGRRPRRPAPRSPPLRTRSSATRTPMARRPCSPAAWNAAVGGVAAGLSRGRHPGSERDRGPGAAPRQRPPPGAHPGRRARPPGRGPVHLRVDLDRPRPGPGAGDAPPVRAGAGQRAPARAWCGGWPRARTWTWPPKHRRSRPALTRSARSGRPSPQCSRLPWKRPWARPGCAAGSATSSVTWPGAASRCCTAS